MTGDGLRQKILDIVFSDVNYSVNISTLEDLERLIAAEQHALLTRTRKRLGIKQLTALDSSALQIERAQSWNLAVDEALKIIDDELKQLEEPQA